MSVEEAFVDLAIAAGLGLLVGLQRETASQTAGIRTFTLITLLGAMAAQLAPRLGGFLVPATLLAVGAIAATAHYISATSSGDRGVTTEVALVAMFLVGVYVVAGDPRYAVVLGGGVAVLLQAKRRFGLIMERLGAEDVRAIMRFVLISLVVLPVLPDQPFGPWGVLNLYEIWLLVVLIVGINLSGYIAWKFLGARAGALLAGLLGGVISSTATTVSYARRSKDDRESAPIATVVIMIATAVVLVRIVIEVAVVAPGILPLVALPFAIVFGVALIISLLAWWRGHDAAGAMPEQHNPTSMKSALTFAALYALVLLAVAWVRENMTDSGLYLVAVVSGLTDVDAITLSTARLAQLGRVTPDHAWRVIMLAYLSNLFFKAGIIAFAGSRRLLLRITLLFALLGAVGGALILFWP